MKRSERLMQERYNRNLIVNTMTRGLAILVRVIIFIFKHSE